MSKVLQQYKLSDEELQENLDIFETYINQLKTSKDKRLIKFCKAITALFDWFVEAPASSRLEHHDCCPSGLFDHSMRVTQYLINLLESFNSDEPLTEDLLYSAIIVGISHDLGKIGDGNTPLYIPEESDWHRNTLGQYYRYNDELMAFKIPHMSLFLLQQHGAELTKEEFQAIMVHDGQHDEGNRFYSMRECYLAQMLHQADMMAWRYELRRWRKFNGLSEDKQ